MKSLKSMTGSKYATHLTTIRYRQIGRKVLQADRLTRALHSPSRVKANTTRRALKLRPKPILITSIVLVVVGAFGFGGFQIYSTHVTAVRKIAIDQQQKRQEVRSNEAAACRQEKAEQKADLIGKVTYDELYDGMNVIGSL